MRYRPFGSAGKAVSAVGLLLASPAVPLTPQACRSLMFAAMESGVNCFEVAAGSEALERGVADTLGAVERRLLFLAWRICGRAGEPLTGERIAQIVRRGLQATRADYFDLLMLDEAAFQGLTPDGLTFLGDLKAAGAALHIGVSATSGTADACIGREPFDVLAMAFDLTSDWTTRRRIKEAIQADMATVALGSTPTVLKRPDSSPAPMGTVRSWTLGRRSNTEPLSGTGGYGFLHATPGWSAEELCLAYALTEPSFATVQIEAIDAETVERLAAVAERELPTGLAAQIEMARFSRDPAPEQKRA